jgi:hypothetical protein
MPTPYEIDRILAALRARYITTERDRAFRTHFDRLLQRSPAGELTPDPVRHTSLFETRGIAVIDGPGGGKTTLVNRALDQHPAMAARAIAEGETGRPYLFAEVRSPATLKSLGQTILAETSYDRLSAVRLRADLFDLVRVRLQLLGITVLWIDEAHDLFRPGARQETETILKTVKSLMKGDWPVIVILTGTERLLQITELDAQISRRFSKLILPEVTEAADGAEIWNVLLQHCARAGLEPPPRERLPGQIIHAGRNRFGRSIEMMVNAIEVALRSGSSRLERQHFAEAFGIHEGCEPDRNVFLVPNWASLRLDPVPDEASLVPARRRKRG